MSAFAAWWAFCQLPANDGQPLHTTKGDPGGPTAQGLTYGTWRVDAPRIGFDGSWNGFTSATPAAFQTIARAFYWNVILAEQMPQSVAVIWADFHFTSGGATACLQRLLGVTPDGVVGTEETLPAIAEAWAAEGAGLLRRLTTARVAYYAALGMPEFLNGWTRRANAGLALGLTLLPPPVGLPSPGS